MLLLAGRQGGLRGEDRAGHGRTAELQCPDRPESVRHQRLLQGYGLAENRLCHECLPSAQAGSFFLTILKNEIFPFVSIGIFSSEINRPVELIFSI